MIWRKVEQLNRTLVANQKHCASAIKKITTITLCGHCLDSELMIINQQESSWAFSGNMTISFWMNHLTRQKWEDEKPKMTKSLHRLAGWAALSPLTSLLETSRVNLLDPIFWTAQLTGDKSKEPWISFIPAHAFSTFSTWPSHLYILVIQLNLLIQCPPYLSMGLRRFNT